jgi:hypothetical protein
MLKKEEFSLGELNVFDTLLSWKAITKQNKRTKMD